MLPRVNPNLFILLSLPKIISQKYLQLLAHHHRFPIQTLLDFKIESPHILSSQPQPLFISSIRIIPHLFLPPLFTHLITNAMLALPSEEEKEKKKKKAFLSHKEIMLKERHKVIRTPPLSLFPSIKRLFFFSSLCHL